jgi:hypothetical protein
MLQCAKREEESGKLLREREKKSGKLLLLFCCAAKLKTNLHAYLGLLLPLPLLLTLPCIHSQ